MRGLDRFFQVEIRKLEMLATSPLDPFLLKTSEKHSPVWSSGDPGIQAEVVGWAERGGAGSTPTRQPKLHYLGPDCLVGKSSFH